MYFVIKMIDSPQQSAEISEKAQIYLESWSSPYQDDIPKSLHDLLFACCSQEISQAGKLSDIAFYKFLVVSAFNHDMSLRKKDA